MLIKKEEQSLEEIKLKSPDCQISRNFVKTSFWSIFHKAIPRLLSSDTKRTNPTKFSFKLSLIKKDLLAKNIIISIVKSINYQYHCLRK